MKENMEKLYDNYLDVFDNSEIRVEKHLGNAQYICEFCGVYKATCPRCNKCEKEE